MDMKKRVLIFLISAIWYGGLQALAQNPSDIPVTAKLADEDESMAVYLNTDREGNEEEFELAQVSVWLFDKTTKRSRRLFLCNPKAEYDISRVNKISGSEIPYVDFVKIWPYTEQPKLVVCGTLPDYRNVSTSIVDVKTSRAIMLPCCSGFVGFDPEEGNLLVASYAYYDEGGRYAIIKAFDENGRQLGSMPIKSKR